MKKLEIPVMNYIFIAGIFMKIYSVIYIENISLYSTGKRGSDIAVLHSHHNQS